MDRIIICLGRSANRRFRRRARECEDPKLVTRYRVLINLDEGRSVADTALALQVAESTVRRVARRCQHEGEAGLVDHREDNGQRKVDEDYLAALHEVVEGSPEDFGWPRPTWTQELLVVTLQKKTGTRISPGTMSRALKQINARRGRPKPTVACPWPKRRKNKRLAEIRQLLAELPPDEIAFYSDEVDIHLNPKIGLDWMVRGQQKEAPTPGKNEKRYLAGAENVRTHELVWVEGEKKNSQLFVLLLWELTQKYPEARVIHVILDNYSIHHTEYVKRTLKTPQGQRIRLHFLPPYCPDHNKIERTWQDVHANVTRNHRCTLMGNLMKKLRNYLHRRNRQIASAQKTAHK